MEKLGIHPKPTAPSSVRPVGDITENEITEHEPPVRTPHRLLFDPTVRLAYLMKALNDKGLSPGPSLGMAWPHGVGVQAA